MRTVEALMWIIGLLVFIGIAFMPFWFPRKATLSDDTTTSADTDRDIWPHTF